MAEEDLTKASETKAEIERRRSEGSSVRFLTALTAFIKAAAWPLIVLFAYLEFRGPLHEAVAVLPRNSSESQKLTVGSLSFEIEKRATAIGDPELGSLIGGLSSAAIEIMLRVNRNESSILSSSDRPDGRLYFVPKENEFLALAELERSRLIDLGVPLSEYRAFLASVLKRTGDSQTRDDYTPVRQLSEAEERRLWQAHYKLTDRGIRAVQLIISAVTRELTRPTN